MNGIGYSHDGNCPNCGADPRKVGVIVDIGSLIGSNSVTGQIFRCNSCGDKYKLALETAAHVTINRPR